MKKWNKRILIITIILIGIAFLKLPLNMEIRITNFVNRHEEELLEISERYLSGETTRFFGEEETYKGAKIWGLQKGEHSVVEFYYSGVGIVPSGTYYGFYYSPDDMPVAVMDQDSPLSPVNENEWEWIGIGDNGGRTKRIKTNWFYYETWF